MSNRTTNAQVNAAFRRLHGAMGWPEMSAYSRDADGNLKANVGAVCLTETGYGWNIEIISNDAGGVHQPFMGWGSKRAAYDGMIDMATAVELYKRQHEERAAA